MHEQDADTKPVWSWCLSWLALMTAFTGVVALALGLFSSDAGQTTALEMTPESPAVQVRSSPSSAPTRSASAPEQSRTVLNDVEQPGPTVTVTGSPESAPTVTITVTVTGSPAPAATVTATSPGPTVTVTAWEHRHDPYGDPTPDMQKPPAP